MPVQTLSRIQRLEARLLKVAAGKPQGRWGRSLAGICLATWTTVYHGRHPLSAGRRLEAVCNLWAWQLWRRTVKRPVQVELQTGALLLCPPWSSIAGAWVSIGIHEYELLFVHDLVRSGDVFFDVGANVGVYAVTAARAGARVVAFEPIPTARRMITRNAALNGAAERVTVSSLALSDFDGQSRFTTDRECGNQLRGPEVTGGATAVVEVRRLDTEAGALLDSVEALTLVKIDVEGFDAKVLAGARETLARHKPSVIVEVWSGGGVVRELLEALGYRAYRYNPEQRALEELSEDFSESGNMVAIHRDRIEIVRRRLDERRQERRHSPRVRWWVDARTLA